MKVLIRIIGGLFIAGGVVHWLIILGVMTEITPFVITYYFHSLAVLSPLTGIGLIFVKNWGRKLGMLIAVTQIPAHAVMIYLDTFSGWQSGVSPWERSIDLVFAVFYLVFFNLKTVRQRFK
jgi:hypothetical protein